MSDDLVVLRYVNVFYYVVFTVYIVLFLIYILPKRKEEPYHTAYKIFLATSIVLIAMEFFGTFSGFLLPKPLRVFYIDGQYNPGIQLILQVIMGFGEGGTSTAIMYLMVDAIYNKEIKKYFALMSIFAIIMIVFASFTFIYTNS